jgi:hypothetical protein
MTPTHSGQYTLPCNPTSSNCVSWEGPDLPCIHLCKGDSVTDAVYKAAVVLCEVKDELNLSELDLQNIFDVCAACPEPEKTLKNILQLLINKVKTLQDLISGLEGSSSGEEIIIRIASCFRTDDGSGDTITELKHSDYTKAIGLQVCTILTTLAGINTRLTSAEDDIDDLKDRVQTLESGNSGLDALTTRVEDLETSVGGLTTVLGSNTDLAQITSEECPTSGVGNSVSSLAAGDGSALWTGTSSNVAESVKRIWLAVCDLRSAVKIIQDNCCQVTCDDIVVDFDVKLSDDRLQATLFFAFKSHIPNGFSDVNALGSKLTITDANGNSAQFFVKITDEVQNPDGLILDLSNSALDPALDYYFSMDASLKSESLTCVKCVTKTITYKDTCAYCQITVDANLHTLSSTSGATDKLIIVYQISGSDSIQYLTILPGQSGVIPKSSTVKSVIKFGDIQYSSTCENKLPDPEDVKCYIMQWTQGSTGSSGDQPLHTGTLEYIKILGATYTLNIFIGDLTSTQNALRNVCSQIPAVEYVTVKDPGSANNQFNKRFVFRTTPTVAATMLMHIVGQGMETYTGGFFLEPFESDSDCS